MIKNRLGKFIKQMGGKISSPTLPPALKFIIFVVIVALIVGGVKVLSDKLRTSTPTPAIKWPVMCKKNTDCPKGSYCMNDDTKTPPYYCKEP